MNPVILKRKNYLVLQKTCLTEDGEHDNNLISETLGQIKKTGFIKLSYGPEISITGELLLKIQQLKTWNLR